MTVNRRLLALAAVALTAPALVATSGAAATAQPTATAGGPTCGSKCTLVAWGWGQYGQMGNGSGTRANPLPVTVNVSGFGTKIAGAAEDGYSLLKNGTVDSWGDGSVGNRGDGTDGVNESEPTKVSNLTNVVAVGGGGAGNGYAITADGKLWAWGEGPGTGGAKKFDADVPVQVPNVTHVVAALDTALVDGYALTSDGHVWSWGSAVDGGLGTGSTKDSAKPAKIASLSGVTAIGAGQEGNEHSWAYAISGGHVWSWGYNAEGELGLGTTASVSVPTEIPGLSKVVAVTGGRLNGYALTSDGHVWAWGSAGGLGSTGTKNATKPVEIPGLSGITAIAGDDLDAYALTSTGLVWGWGYNGDGELGNGKLKNSAVPVKATISKVKTIAAGGQTVYAVVGS